MDTARRALAALIAATALAGSGAARSAEPEAIATAPVAAPATTPATPPPATSVADQIDVYLKTSPALALPKDGPDGVTSGEEPRKAHGFVDITVGSNGYRSAYARSDLPVGKTGTLSIGVGETRFNGRFGGYGGAYGGRFGPGDRQSLALGLRMGGGAAPDPLDARCRQSGEERPDLASDPRIEGGSLRACQTAGAPTSPQ